MMEKNHCLGENRLSLIVIFSPWVVKTYITFECNSTQGSRNEGKLYVTKASRATTGYEKRFSTKRVVSSTGLVRLKRYKKNNKNIKMI